jgi:hypothetical protein
MAISKWVEERQDVKCDLQQGSTGKKKHLRSQSPFHFFFVFVSMHTCTTMYDDERKRRHL